MVVHVHRSILVHRDGPIDFVERDARAFTLYAVAAHAEENATGFPFSDAARVAQWLKM